MQGIQAGEGLYAECVGGLGAGRTGEEESEERGDEVCVQGGAGVCGEDVSAGECADQCGDEDQVTETLGCGGRVFGGGGSSS